VCVVPFDLELMKVDGSSTAEVKVSGTPAEGQTRMVPRTAHDMGSVTQCVN
jgi:hypothetical protein